MRSTNGATGGWGDKIKEILCVEFSIVKDWTYAVNLGVASGLKVGYIKSRDIHARMEYRHGVLPTSGLRGRRFYNEPGDSV